MIENYEHKCILTAKANEIKYISKLKTVIDFYLFYSREITWKQIYLFFICSVIKLL